MCSYCMEGDISGKKQRVKASRLGSAIRLPDGQSYQHDHLEITYQDSTYSALGYEEGKIPPIRGNRS